MATEEYFPCNLCERKENCINYLSCLNCGKMDPILNFSVQKKEPGLRVYAERCIENLPIEPSWVAVDKDAIRFFTRKPSYVNQIWTSKNPEEEIATFRYDFLDGLFDYTFYSAHDELLYHEMCLLLN